jgi:hypothetical protein
MDYCTIAGPWRWPILGSRALECFNGPGMVLIGLSPFPLPRSPATSKSTGGDRLRRTVLTDSARRVSGLVSPFVSALARRSVAGTEKAAGGHSMMAVSPRYELNSGVIGSLQLID